jgi:hypothetical protein
LAARTFHPFLLGQKIQEEFDDDIKISKAEKMPYQTQEAFTTENPSMARMMEQEIARVADEWRTEVPGTLVSCREYRTRPSGRDGTWNPYDFPDPDGNYMAIVEKMMIESFTASTYMFLSH